MLPVYRYMDSYPQSSPHYPQHHYPSWDSNPSQMKFDPAKSPIAYQPWTPCGSYGYSVPVECHGCCNHGYTPGYYSFRPPYIHLPPPAPHYYHGPYPSYPETYPACFVPPHCPMEQPRYEFDKNLSKNHSCGCPNHKNNSKEDRKVMIEEQAPDDDKTDGKSSVPIKYNNYPHPIMWIPSEYMNKESNRSSETEPKIWGWFPPMKPNESMQSLDQDPNVRYGWFPFDLNGFKSLMQGGEKNRVQPNECQEVHSSKQRDDKEVQYPLPIIWMPSYDKPEEVKEKSLEEINAKSKSERSPDNNEHDEKPVGIDNSSGEIRLTKATKDSMPKIIPVKQMDECSEKTSQEAERIIPVKQMDECSENTLQEAKRVIPVKQMDESSGKTSQEADGNSKSFPVKKKEEDKSPDGPRRQSSSPPKASKLPPVCLRVDPFPRKKNVSGTSRSPSPPGHNDSATASGLKDKMQHNSKALECAKNKAIDVSSKNEETAAIKFHGKTEDQKEKGEVANGDQSLTLFSVPTVSHGEMQGESTTKTVEMGDSEHKRGEQLEAEEKLPQEPNQERKKVLSPTEAAVVIQSAYRGFQLRKWEPLKKLKQITRIQQQVEEVRNHIHDLESSPDLWKDEKQRIFIGETIMNLLLQLDTIQGLHPSLRNIRKSAARELTQLQEKLDFLANQKSEEVAKEVLPVKPIEDQCEVTKDGGCCMLSGPNVEQKEAENGKKSDAVVGETKVTEFEEPLIKPDDEMNKKSDVVVGETATTQESGLEGPAELPSVETAKRQQSEQETDSGLDGYAEPTAVEIINTQQSEHESEAGVEGSAELPLVVEEQKDHKIEQHAESSSTDELCSKLEANGEEMKCSESLAMDKNLEMNHLEEVAEVVIDELSNSMNNDISQDGEVESSEIEVQSSAPKAEATDMNEPVHMSIAEELSASELAECPPGEVNEDVFQKDGDASTKPDVLLALLPGKEQLMGVSKPEEPGQWPLLGDDGNVEELAGVVQSDMESVASVDQVATLTETDLPGKEVAERDVKEQPVTAMGAPKDGDLMEELLKGGKKEFEESEITTEIQVVEEAVIDTDSAPAIADSTEEEKDMNVHGSDSGEPVLDEQQARREMTLVKENEKLREALEQLIQAGKEQLSVICNLNKRVKDLEKKLTRKKKLRMRRHNNTVSSHEKLSNA